MHPFYIVLSKPKIRYWTMVCFTFMHYSKVQDPQTPGVLVLMKLGNVACYSAVPIRGGGGERQLCAVSCGVLQGQQCGQVCIMLHLSHRLCHRRQRDHLPQRLRHQWVLIVIFWLFFFFCFLFLYILKRMSLQPVISFYIYYYSIREGGCWKLDSWMLAKMKDGVVWLFTEMTTPVLRALRVLASKIGSRWLKSALVLTPLLHPQETAVLASTERWPKPASCLECSSLSS